MHVQCVIIVHHRYTVRSSCVAISRACHWSKLPFFKDLPLLQYAMMFQKISTAFFTRTSADRQVICGGVQTVIAGGLPVRGVGLLGWQNRGARACYHPWHDSMHGDHLQGMCSREYDRLLFFLMLPGNPALMIPGFVAPLELVASLFIRIYSPKELFSTIRIQSIVKGFQSVPLLVGSCSVWNSTEYRITYAALSSCLLVFGPATDGQRNMTEKVQ